MQNRQQSPRCPRCGGRLFEEREFLGRRPFYFWECSLGCSRSFYLDGSPMASAGKAREKRVRCPEMAGSRAI